MSTRSPSLPALLLALPVILAGCSALTPYQRPAVQVPEQWQGPVQTSVAADASGHSLFDQDRWWQMLGDAQLGALIDEALARNGDLAAAGWKLRSARLAAGNAAADLWPTPSASLTASRALDINSHNHSRSAAANLALSWEADLWGKLAARHSQAEWEAAATEQDRQAVAQTLVVTVARSYWRIALLDAQIAAQHASIATARQTLALVDVQYQAGAASGLEQAQARQSLSSQQAALTALEHTRQELRHALAILFDGPPQALPAAAQTPHLPNTAALPAWPAGVPAAVLARRPDVRAAEMRLRSALAHVDATRASYYPSLTLTGALGSGSQALSQVLQNPVLTLGAGLVLPFIQAGEMRRNTAVAQSSHEQAVIAFRQSLYNALAEVENALSQREQLTAQEHALTESLQSARRAEALTEVRYRAGAIAMKAWLDAQDTRRRAEMELLDVQYQRASNLLNAYQALGGSPLQAPLPYKADADSPKM